MRQSCCSQSQRSTKAKKLFKIFISHVTTAYEKTVSIAISQLMLRCCLWWRAAAAATVAPVAARWLIRRHSIRRSRRRNPIFDVRRRLAVEFQLSSSASETNQRLLPPASLGAYQHIVHQWSTQRWYYFHCSYYSSLNIRRSTFLNCVLSSVISVILAW